MFMAASMHHGQQQESVHCPRRWCFYAWRRLPSSRSKTVEDGAGEEAPCTMTTVDQCSRGGARKLRCRGEVYFVVGMENGEYSGVLLWVPGWGWLGRVNLKLRKQAPTKRNP